MAFKVGQKRATPFRGKPRICVLGPGNFGLDRNLVLLEGLKVLGIPLSFVQSRSFDTRTALVNSQDSRFLGKHRKLWFSLLPRVFLENISLLRASVRARNTIRNSDVLLIPSMGNYCVFAAKIWSLLFGIPLVLDAHGSLYLPRILGVGDYQDGSLYAKLVYWIDKSGMLVSTKYMTYCNSYKNWLVGHFGVSRDRFIAVFVGKFDDRTSTESKTTDKLIHVIQCSGFKLFHGAIQLVKAAAVLKEMGREDIKIVLVGDGPELSACKQFAEEHSLGSVEFLGRLQRTETLAHLHAAKIVCGQLAANTLNDVDASNKVYEAALLGKAMITVNSRSTKELFEDGKSVILCPGDDPRALASAILALIDDEARRTRMGKAARDVYDRFLTPRAVATQFLSELGIADTL